MVHIWILAFDNESAAFVIAFEYAIKKTSLSKPSFTVGRTFQHSQSSASLSLCYNRENTDVAACPTAFVINREIRSLGLLTRPNDPSTTNDLFRALKFSDG